jgi:polysaccharide pyruvyl transferase WcaK-like protein
MTITRREFLYQTACAAITGGASPSPAAGLRPRRILLRSSWQVVNIGDIAHTPGALALLEKHLPEAEVRLWASHDFSGEAAAMMSNRFPGLAIVKGEIGENGASTPELQNALEWCDFLLHGSGPSLVAARDLAAFTRRTGKPFGVYGITHGSYQSGDDKEILSRAKFVFFRDSVSLGLAQAEGVKSPVLEFGPDAAFACDLRNDARATAFLRNNQLDEGKFLCCLSRLRYTPYWKIRNQPVTDESRRRAARNEAMAEHDHAPLLDAILAVVRETPLKVLLCPEDLSQMEVTKRWLYDKLPAAARSRVVWRAKFWLPDEALSVYRHSAGLFGLEMHSPIMCIGNGVPAIVGRFEEQTSKGIMWRDIGLGDWLFDFDQESEIARYAPAVLAMAKNPAEAKAKTAAARRFVGQRQRETMKVLRAELEKV